MAFNAPKFFEFVVVWKNEMAPVGVDPVTNETLFGNVSTAHTEATPLRYVSEMTNALDPIGLTPYEPSHATATDKKLAGKF